jgi:mannose-6-phosphate isomerase
MTPMSDARPADLAPIIFEPLFIDRIWGGRSLEKLFGKELPPGEAIGESWEIVDRAEAQSVVATGEFAGRTLHEFWEDDRRTFFGDVPDSNRFPILVKLLDAREKLSIQVHPPPAVAEEFGDETKTEMWWIAAADPGAELYAGLKRGVTRDDFAAAIGSDKIVEQVHRFPVKAGDAMFLPAGRVHAVGSGLVLFEIQQNSDTTYRVYDWNRIGGTGRPRELHIDEALRSINFSDEEPQLIKTGTSPLASCDSFIVEHWDLSSARDAAAKKEFALVACLTGAISCHGVVLEPGHVFLVPAMAKDKKLVPDKPGTTLLRVTLPRA